MIQLRIKALTTHACPFYAFSNFSVFVTHACELLNGENDDDDVLSCQDEIKETEASTN